MKSKGILLPVFSLPSRYGIGDFGAEAYKFVDFLAETGQNIWQILPLNPTSFGDSPYQSPSAYAGNPYFIDLEALFREGLLTAEELAGQAEPQGNIDYARLYGRRYEILRLAFSRFDANGADFMRFCAQTPWLADYCDFMALKDKNGGRSWQAWPEAERRRGSARAPEGEAKFYAFLQFWFFRQWKALKGYANGKGIRIVGDLPIYVSADSADVWSQPAYFQLDENLCPTAVAGVPPDGFTPDGQLWGNPLYNWERLEEEGFAWWIERFRAAFEMYDMVRVDHFRGFAAYFAVPFGDKTAKNGKWVQAPGKALFAKVKEAFPAAPVWAEDLGYLDESVRELLAYTGYPGMKILQFAFDSKKQRISAQKLPGKLRRLHRHARQHDIAAVPRRSAGHGKMAGAPLHAPQTARNADARLRAGGAAKPRGYGCHSHAGLSGAGRGGARQHPVHPRRQLGVAPAAELPRIVFSAPKKTARALRNGSIGAF